MYARMRVWTYVCMHVCMYARMHVCMHVCMCACMRVCVYACTHVAHQIQMRLKLTNAFTVISHSLARLLPISGKLVIVLAAVFAMWRHV